ncbi:MAG: hypothetical protein KAH86_08845 [Methanosarcinales archaeon]|nr:hypothetical protein [Methanosarcinales archaeon]
MKTLLLFMIAYLASFTLHAIMASKRNKKYSQAIAGLMMTLAFILFFFDLLVFGTAFIIAAALILLWKSSENRDLQRKRMLQDFRSVDDTEPLALTDFLSWKSWGKITMKYGAKKAALLCSLFYAIIITVLFFSLIDFFEDFSGTFFYFTYVISYSSISYFINKNLFEQTLKNIDNEDEVP